MPLTDVSLKAAKPADKQYKLHDERGLFIIISPAGGKWWRFKYRFGGKEKLLSLGTYPELSLKEAREQRDIARKQVAAGIDPSGARKAAKTANSERGANSFEVVAIEWFQKHSPNWVEGHSKRIKSRLEQLVFPWLGAMPISDVTPPELLKVLRRIESGSVETAHRVMQTCSQIFRYAVATGRAERDPSGDLRGALPPFRGKHFASITAPKDIGKLLRDLDGYRGAFTTRCALRLAPLVFVRPGELRKAEWAEINFDTAEWRISADKMKMREQHIVPLSTQALDILRELHPLTGNGKYLFPGARSNDKPMSENTVLAALRNLGYEKDEMTGHGFRSMASTLLNEMGWNHDAIERQLAHSERSKVRAAYNYAEYMPERKRMMQAWADYLDGLKCNSNIATIHKRLSNA